MRCGLLAGRHRIGAHDQLAIGDGVRRVVGIASTESHHPGRTLIVDECSRDRARGRRRMRHGAQRAAGQRPARQIPVRLHQDVGSRGRLETRILAIGRAHRRRRAGNETRAQQDGRQAALEKE